MRLPRGAAAGLALSVTLSLAVLACDAGNGQDADHVRDRVRVSGDFGTRPTVRIEAPLEVRTSSSWMTIRGKGDLVGGESTAVLHLTLTDARTGKTAVSTLDSGQHPLEVKLGEQVFPSLVEALTGKPTDSRVVVASTAEEAYGESGAPQVGIEAGDPVVMVADILSADPTTVLDGPTGPSHPVPLTAPAVREENGTPAKLDFAGRQPPSRLVAIELREGTGPVVEAPDRISADYLGQVWGTDQPFQETYTKEHAGFSIGLGSVVKAWDQALVGRREGARVLILCPPALGYGATAKPGIPANSPLAFVVDILGVG